MKCRPFDAGKAILCIHICFLICVRKIQPISNQRMPCICHMYANLVCSSGFQGKLHQCRFHILFLHLIMCDCRFAVF